MSFTLDVIAGFTSIRSITGVSVTVARGAVTNSLVAVPGDSLHQFSADGQVTSEFKSRDFLILVSDYKFDDVAALPERGDKITIAGQTFAILSDSGEAYFRYSDVHQNIIRIHCKPI